MLGVGWDDCFPACLLLQELDPPLARPLQVALAKLRREVAREHALGRHLAGSPGEHYYEHWLSALEELVCTIGATTAEELAERYDAWDRAARATRHGRPIVLPTT